MFIPPFVLRYRITSYNVCYTKLLRADRLHNAGHDFLGVGHRRPALPLRQRFEKALQHLGRSVQEVRSGEGRRDRALLVPALDGLDGSVVDRLESRITSYNVCYTKLLRDPTI